MAGVDPRVYLLAAFGGALFGREKFQFGFQAEECGLREAVRKMKGHMLGHVGTLKVREIAAAVPPGSANLPIGVFLPTKLGCGGVRIAKLGGIHFAKLGVIHTANREIGVPRTLLRVVH